MQSEIFCLRDAPFLLGQATQWFHEKWNIPPRRLSTEHSGQACAACFLATRNGRILSGLGVIENDTKNRSARANPARTLLFSHFFDGYAAV